MSKSEDRGAAVEHAGQLSSRLLWRQYGTMVVHVHARLPTDPDGSVGLQPRVNRLNAAGRRVSTDLMQLVAGSQQAWYS